VCANVADADGSSNGANDVGRYGASNHGLDEENDWTHGGTGES
jgi:hypothetical protein